MVERPARGVFGGIWAFPGGAVEEDDDSFERYGFVDAWRAAALRETAEEVGIFLTEPPSARPVPDVGADVFGALSRAGARFDPGRLRYVASWITPTEVPRRFDARFYVASVDAEVEGSLHTQELVDMEWVGPTEILRRVEDDEWAMIFPTVWLVELLAETHDPLAMPPHPIRQLSGFETSVEVSDLGIPVEERGA